MRLFLIVPCYNEEEGIEVSARTLGAYMRDLISRNIVKAESKIVFVNDGSSDGTRRILKQLHENDPLFSVINFSRNYGHQYAVMAGYMFAKDKCDACISIDADLQQDIHAIEWFIDSYNAGNDIVYGVRNARDTDTAFKRLTSQWFYKLMQLMGCNIIPNHADYRLMSNKALTALSEYGDSTVFLRGIIPTLGFNSTIVYFDVKDRTAGESKYTLKKMVTLAGDGITSLSDAPIRLISYMGAISLIIGLIGTLCCAFANAFFSCVPTFAFFVLILFFFSGLIMLSNGIVGIYVSRCYQESKGRPRYLIDETLDENLDRNC